MRPDAAHCDLELTVAAWPRPLQCKAGEDDGKEKKEEAEEKEKAQAKEEEKTALITSNNPRLTGGERRGPNYTSIDTKQQHDVHAQ